MVLKFLGQSFVARDPRGGGGDNWASRFPQGSQPIATAPQHSAQPVWVMTANGQGNWALHHNGAWQKLQPFKDFKSGAVTWRMNGEQISQPVAWSMPRKK